MIDLIIPYYNNPEGLKRTLDSINQNIFYVTIIDDSSDQLIKNPKVDQVFRSNRNRGPGMARQLGINKTNNDYIMFLDTGDIFVSYEVQETILQTVEDNPQFNVISFSYLHYGEPAKETDNRMHGKVYKRSFLREYGITFTPESSYLNEDIGFNRTCKLCTDVKFIPLIVIEQIKEQDSLTQKDNQVVLYKDQTRALSLVSLHTIDICRKNNISVEKEINQIAIALYYWFIRAAAERPEFIQDAWAGAKIFYDALAQEIKPNQLSLGNVYIKKCLKYRSQINFPINILRFADDIKNNKIIPKRYGVD